MKKMITCLLNKINLSKMNRYKHEKLTKILTIALLALILLSVFSISFMHFTYAITSEGGYPSSSSVSDLTNTTWYVWSGWSSSAGYGVFNINYDFSYSTVSETNMSKLSIGYQSSFPPMDQSDVAQADYIEFIPIFYGTGPNNAIIITINGGDDATNTSLINWLETNGTQLKVTDLTDTTWNVSAGWEAEAGYGQFNVDCSIDNGDTDILLSIGYKYNPMTMQYSSQVNLVCYGGLDSLRSNVSSSNSFTLAITGGTDATNPKLIAWLSKWGELQGSEPDPDPDPDPVTTYDLPDTIWYFDDELTWNGMLQYYDDFMATEFLMPYNHLSLTTSGDLINGIDVIMTYYDDDDDTVVVYNSNLGGWQIDDIGARAIYFPLNFDITNPFYDSIKTFMNTNATLIVEPKNLRQDSFDQGADYGFNNGYNQGYSKGESNSLVTGFFGNFLTGIVQAVDSIHFYEYTIDDMGTEDTSDDQVFYISPWSIFVVFIGLALVIIFLKVFRGG